jgi:hypothetical protein
VANQYSKRSTGAANQFAVVQWLLSSFGFLHFDMFFQPDVRTCFGSFLAAVVHGKNGIPAQDLLAHETRPNYFRVHRSYSAFSVYDDEMYELEHLRGVLGVHFAWSRQ